MSRVRRCAECDVARSGAYPGAGVELNLYRHKKAVYFLPSDDEWDKAAYHKNDGVNDSPSERLIFRVLAAAMLRRRWRGCRS